VVVGPYKVDFCCGNTHSCNSCCCPPSGPLPARYHRGGDDPQESNVKDMIGKNGSKRIVEIGDGIVRIAEAAVDERVRTMLEIEESRFHRHKAALENLIRQFELSI
jgi:hypothetical protein